MSDQSQTMPTSTRQAAVADERAEQAQAKRVAELRRRKLGYQKLVIRVISLIVVLTAWQVFGAQIDPILFTTPIAVFKAAVVMIGSGELWHYLWPSLQVMLVGGDIDFLIIGSTPMSDPAQVFGNPRPSWKKLADGDMILMELAAGYRGYSAQVGSPICVGEPLEPIRRFWDEIAKPGFVKMAAEIKPGNPVDALRIAGQFFRENGVQSRPIHCHGIDLVSDGPHVFVDHIDVEPFEEIMKPGMVIMAEPNPISADGMLGMFVGHTFIVTETGSECVDEFPLELVVAKS